MLSRLAVKSAPLKQRYSSSWVSLMKNETKTTTKNVKSISSPMIIRTVINGSFQSYQQYKNYSHSFDVVSTPLLAAAAAVGLVTMNATNNDWFMESKTKCDSKASSNNLHPSPTPVGVGKRESFEDKVDTTEDLDLPVFTSAQVAENNGENGKPIWMSYGGIVYDVSDFIHNHPGGSERIMLAAGSAIEPFWHLYRGHFANELPMRLMEKLIIGKLHDDDQQVIDDQMEQMINETEDPYAHEPKRCPKLIVHGDQPMNAEVPSELITDSYITPVELFYIRHHHPVPLLMEKDVEEYEVEIDLSLFPNDIRYDNGKDDKKSTIIRKISLDDIKKLPKVEVTTTLQCSGNRRGDMNKVQSTSGTAWGQGAISTAKWGGARLVDVLILAGVKDPIHLTEKDDTQKHVRFESLDGMKASIHMEKATNPFGDVIIAYEMNDQPLPREHGFPLRAIVPGYSAVRNVKWIKKIEISTEEAEGAWQRGLNYKTLPPNVTDAKSVNLRDMPSMTEVSLFSGITKMEVLKREQKEEDNNKVVMVKAKGWAWAGSGRNVVRVDITGDNGKSWTTANITQGGDQKFGRAWAWVFWECDVPATVGEDGTVQLSSKAVDMAFNSQPEHIDHTWNVRGLGNNSWYRAEIKI